MCVCVCGGGGGGQALGVGDNGGTDSRGWGGRVTEGGQTSKIKNRPSHHEIVSSKKFW